MDKFYFAVVGIAIVILILMLTVIGIMTSCSANLESATGSASKTLVSKTYVIRPGSALIPAEF